MKNIFRIAEIILIIVILISCDKEDKSTLPFLTTTIVTEITQTGAFSGGTVNSDGGADVTARGICWDTIANPSISGLKTTNGAGIGSFTSNMTNLIPNTKYYVKAYATNSVGTAYGNEISFTTNLLVIASLTTIKVASITSSTAVSGGSITSDGGGTIINRGVCWSTSENPTISTTNTTSDGTGTGNYSSSLTNLLPDTTYYVKAYATNEIGTSYGNQLSFKTFPAKGSFIDSRDGNEYGWIEIGEQIWMSENLAYLPYVTLYNLYSPIDYCYYVYGYYGMNTEEAAATDYYKTYGAIYNWPAAMDDAASSNNNPSGVQGVCPTGWHLPSLSEWKELIDYLGGEDIAGGKMKETGTLHWAAPNTESTNSSGFTALPGGYYVPGNFHDVKGYGGWWSSEEVNSDTTKANTYRTLDGYRTIKINVWLKYNGSYVRCVKNK
jgi:uncharacterized protein (TIGR02145 family)